MPLFVPYHVGVDKFHGEDNVSELVLPKAQKARYKVYFGVFDARDPSLVPLQLILFVLASIEAVQGVLNIVHPGESSNPHIYAHLGAYSLAYVSALYVIACRPARARGLLILVTVAACGFVVTSILDVVRDQAELAGEIQHVTKLFAPFIVWIIASRVVNFSRPLNRGNPER